MKVQKAMSVLATLSILSFGVACSSGGGGGNDRYAEGLAAGKEQGYSEGYGVGYNDGFADGDEAGYARAKEYFSSMDYNKGFADGKAAGLTEGYNNGYTVGKKDGLAEGYTTGYNVGYTDGDKAGYTRGYETGYDDGFDDGGAGAYEAGYTAGFDAGYDDGHTDGVAVGYDTGYDAGYDDGYDVGYDDGFDDGYALSVGPSPKLKGYADVLSAAHNDLFDYSKIKAPKQTKRGLVANGRLLLSEVSMTNKDTLKRAAVVEQYLVVEMAKQVKGKFGLSDERSLKVAKASNHFRKFASKNALTPEDTNAYASEIVGADFSAIQKAYENSLKGDLSDLNSLIEKAAEKNEISPEKMTEVLTKMFI